MWLLNLRNVFYKIIIQIIKDHDHHYSENFTKTVYKIILNPFLNIWLLNLRKPFYRIIVQIIKDYENRH